MLHGKLVTLSMESMVPYIQNKYKVPQSHSLFLTTSHYDINIVYVAHIISWVPKACLQPLLMKWKLVMFKTIIASVLSVEERMKTVSV